MLVKLSLLSLMARSDRRVVVVTGMVLVVVAVAEDGIVDVNSAEGESVSGAYTSEGTCLSWLSLSTQPFVCRAD